MKLLIFAHSPPPHHGQSYMVELMLSRLGGNQRRRHPANGPATGAELGIECYHVNSRLSRKLEQIGDFRVSKLLLLLGYCLQAIWCRFRYGVKNFYYIPAPGKTSALYRDWLVLFLCRPFFQRLVLHWHASGLGRWLETTARPRLRTLTYKAARQADLSIALSHYGKADAEKLYPLRIAIVGNGIPDPCPDFSREVLPRRRSRLEARQALLTGGKVASGPAAATGAGPQVYKALFLGHCTREKGLFDAIRGAVVAQRKLASTGSPVSLELAVAGRFVDPAEEREFREYCAGEGARVVQYVGYLEGDLKRRWLVEADVFCFPSHIESFGLVLAEAMAFGLPVVTARCGAIPEVMGADYPGLVHVRRPEQIGDALLRMMTDASFEALRRRFEENFTVEHHVGKLAAALRSIERAPAGSLGAPFLVPVEGPQFSPQTET